MIFSDASLRIIALVWAYMTLMVLGICGTYSLGLYLFSGKRKFDLVAGITLIVVAVFGMWVLR